MREDGPVSQAASQSLSALGYGRDMVVVGLGAFALVPGERNAQPEPRPHGRSAAGSPQPVRSPPRMLENGAPFSFADLVERVSPAVVTITASRQVSRRRSDRSSTICPRRSATSSTSSARAGSQPQPHKAISMGSGFIIDKAGLIVTNNHVIDGAKKITVKLPDGRSFDAKLIGTDAATDIACSRSRATSRFRPSSSATTASCASATGWSRSAIRSACPTRSRPASSPRIGRDIGSGPYTDFIQIDAPINRGNSGGPTFDLRGQVIGMNSMIYLAVGRQRRHRLRHSVLDHP